MYVENFSNPVNNIKSNNDLRYYRKFEVTLKFLIYKR